MGRDPCGVYSVSSFLLGIGVGHLWRFSAFVVYLRDAGWSFYFIYLLLLLFLFIIFILRGVACSVYGALGWDPCGVYSVSRFLLGIGVGHLWRFSAFVAFMRHAGWSVYFIYLFIVWRGVAWRGVACSVYGALVWGPCGVHSVWSVYEAFGLVIFCPFRVFAAFTGHWGGTLVAFTVLVVFYWALGLDICGAFQRL